MCVEWCSTEKEKKLQAKNTKGNFLNDIWPEMKV